MMRKSMAGPVTIKNADQGIVEAVFATFNVVDHDGDLTLPEAITANTKCVISAYGHQSWNGELPVGWGTITKTSDEAIITAQFLLDTPHGRAAFDTVKALAEQGLGEWSYGLMNVKAERKTIDGRQVRVLKAIDIPEVSPTLVGAGINTRTTATKSARKQLHSDIYDQLRDLGRERWGDDTHWVYVEDYDADELFAIFYISAEDEPTRLLRVTYTRDGDTISLGDDETEVERDLVYSPKSGLRFVEQAKAVVTALDRLVARAEGIAAKRLEDGKSKALGDEAASLLSDADALLVRLKTIATTPHHDPIDDEARREFARFVGITEGVI